MARNIECIYERSNSYQVKINYYDENGKRTPYTKSFPVRKYGTKAKALEEAKKHRDGIRVKLNNKQIVKEKHASLEEIYTKAFNLHQVALNTRRKDDSNFYNHFANVIDIKRDFRSFTFSDIQEQLNSMISDCSQDMIKRALYIWKTCYRYAIADDYVSKDQTLKVTLPKSEKIIKAKDQTTSYSEVVRAIELIEKRTQNQRDRFLYVSAIWLGLYLGMRPSEIFALETSAIDFENKQIKVYQRIGSTTTEKYAIVKVKTDSSVRTIDYPPELEDTLRELVDNAIDGYLFKKSNGKLLNGDEFSDRLNKATDGTFRAYPMRHQLTTDLLEQGFDLRTIMEIMGHSEGTMTLYYARSNQKKRKEAINNRVINGKEEDKKVIVKAEENKENEVKTA